MATAVYKTGNTIIIDDGVNEVVESFSAQTRFYPEYVNGVITQYNVLDAWNGNSLLAKITASEIVDENGDPYADFEAWRYENTGFNPAAGGSAADKSNQILINETITNGYDTGRWQISGGTMSEVGGKLRIVCPQAPTTAVLTNGLKNASITAININPTVWKHTALLDYEIDCTFRIVTSGANRQYIGFGVKGTGERNPLNGGVVLRHSTTPATNGYFVCDQENAIVNFNSVLAVGDKIRIVSNVYNSQFDYKLYINDVLVRTGKVSYQIELDLKGRFGLFSLFGWACTFDVESFKVTDLAYKTYDIAVVGDSITEGWGVQINTNIQNYARLLQDKSLQAVKIFAKSSQTINDGLLNITEILAGSPSKVMIMLGTNPVVMNKSLSTLQTEFQALMAAYTTAGFTGTRYVCTIPPILGNATQNTRAFDFNQWLISTYGNATGYKVVNFYSQLIVPSTTTFDSLKSNDNLHPNVYGHQVMFEYLQANFPELFTAV